ncbi:MAG: hypothetical protein QOJ49_34 [Actinomycetota bacterium]|jgi:hypothetical protein|nr:hypothetical protein [Actinomycetota bacterium]
MRTAPSIGTGLILMAIGGILTFAVQAPASVTEYVNVGDLGLILIWSGVLVLVMLVVMYRPRRPRTPLAPEPYDEDRWADRDVHRSGYPDETNRIPTVRARQFGHNGD